MTNYRSRKGGRPSSLVSLRFVESNAIKKDSLYATCKLVSASLRTEREQCLPTMWKSSSVRNSSQTLYSASQQSAVTGWIRRFFSSRSLCKQFTIISDHSERVITPCVPRHARPQIPFATYIFGYIRILVYSDTLALWMPKASFEI